jgi:hypothetical protein
LVSDIKWHCTRGVVAATKLEVLSYVLQTKSMQYTLCFLRYDIADCISKSTKSCSKE